MQLSATVISAAVSTLYVVKMTLKYKNQDLGFSKRHRGSVRRVLEVQHGSARRSQGLIQGVDVALGQPIGQVCMQTMHLLLLLLEEQLSSNQTFISCSFILPAGRGRLKIFTFTSNI